MKSARIPEPSEGCKQRGEVIVHESPESYDDKPVIIVSSEPEPVPCPQLVLQQQRFEETNFQVPHFRDTSCCLRIVPLSAGSCLSGIP